MAETTEKKQSFKMVASPLPPEEMYADGVNAIIGRPGVIKLECYRVLGVDRETNAEIRTVIHRLVLPAVALPELVGLFQKMVEAGQRAAAETKNGDGGAKEAS
jgi:hypothetical protein